MDFEFMPPWAMGLTHGEYVLGAHLPTRDGRICGNAHVIEAEQSTGKYTVLTDAGSTMRLSERELKEMFHPPRFVSSVEQVKKRFTRKEDEGV